MFLDITGLQEDCAKIFPCNVDCNAMVVIKSSVHRIIYEIRLSIEHVNLPEREAQCSPTAGTKENGN